MSYLGFSLGKNEGDGEDDDNHGDYTPFTLLASSLHPTSLHYTTQGGTTMNSEKKPWRWRKRKEEMSPNRFLEMNGED